MGMELIQPHLATNLFQSHVLAVKREEPHFATNLFTSHVLAVKREADAGTLHQNVLGRAANCETSNPDILVWMFLSSKNVNDFVLLEERQAHVLEDGTALAVKREADTGTLQQNVLGRAPNCATSNPNILVWMFLSSKNVEDFVLLEERQAQIQVQEDGTSYREVTMAVPVAEAGSKRKR
jgi:hypothetical protein